MFAGVAYGDFVLRGLEGVQKGPKRRWTTQKSLCEVLKSQSAREYFKHDKKQMELMPSVPPGPPPSDPDDPFARE